MSSCYCDPIKSPAKKLGFLVQDILSQVQNLEATFCPTKLLKMSRKKKVILCAGKNFAEESWQFPTLHMLHTKLVAGTVLMATSLVLCAASWDTSQLESRNATGKAERRGGFSCSLPGRPSVTQSCQNTEHLSWFLFCTQLLSFARAEEIELFLRLPILSQIWTKLTPHLKYNKEGLSSRQHGHKGSGCLGIQPKGKSLLYESKLKILSWCHKSDLNTSDGFYLLFSSAAKNTVQHPLISAE